MSRSKRVSRGEAAYLGLGSNLGDRRANLAGALDRLDACEGIRVFRVSSAYLTAPVGMDEGQPEFLNAVAEIRTSFSPEALLRECLAVEKLLGRFREGRWASRTIDIDLLAFGRRRRATSELELPHPRMVSRAFVLVPLAEIAPDLAIQGRRASDWAKEVGAAGVTRLEGDLWKGRL